MRRTISLKICFMGWLMELVGTAMTMLTPTLRSYGLHHLYYPDAIVVFIMIPFIHVMNEENVKIVVFERGWFQALMHIFGKRNEIRPK